MTTTVRRYADTKDISLRKAFIECFVGVKYDSLNAVPSIGDLTTINQDFRTFLEIGDVPNYVVLWLEHFDKKEIEYRARASPAHVE